MDQGLKERLIGAVVLAALAVWLIPWLLDGPVEPIGGERAVLELPVPSGHIGEIRTEVIDLAPRRGVADAPASASREPAAARPAETEPAAAANPASSAPIPSASSPRDAAPGASTDVGDENVAAAREATTAPSGTAGRDTDAAPPARATERSGETPRTASPPPAAAATTAPPPAAATATTPPPAAARRESPAPAATGDWAVQLGSFSDEDNARRLVSRVASAGHEATISTFRSNGRTMYRVRVGPQPTRAAAEAAAAALAARGFDTQIVTAR